MPETCTARDELIALTADVVAAHVAHNSVPADELPGLIAVVHAAFVGLGATPAIPEAKAIRRPAVPVSRSIQPDHLVCLEDGRKLKTLKRHLRTHYQLTPDAYRARWNLPADYPMIAPDLAERRRQVALKAGLGRKATPGLIGAEPLREQNIETVEDASGPVRRPRRKLTLALPGSGDPGQPAG